MIDALIDFGLRLSYWFTHLLSHKLCISRLVFLKDLSKVAEFFEASIKPSIALSILIPESLITSINNLFNFLV